MSDRQELIDDFCRELDDLISRHWENLKPDMSEDMPLEDIELFTNSLPGPWVLISAPEFINANAAFVTTYSRMGQSWFTTSGLCHEAIK